MKRNYLLAIAVAVLMLASEVAWAADISFSGQFRPRYNMNEDTTDTTNGDHNFTTRVRLNAKANVNANTGVFLQMQSVGTWGNNGAAGGDRRSTTVSDTENSVGLHQAFVTLKNFFGQPVNAKIGRQEVVLDGHRLFGHTGWTDGAQTNDAIRLDHSGGNHTLNYIYIAQTKAQGAATNTTADASYHVLRAATQGVLGGDLAGYFVITDDRAISAVDFGGDENEFYTIGARQKGKLGGLDYRVEYYHQFGDGGVEASAAGFTPAYDGPLTEVDRDAHMFGIRVGKTFKNVRYSPTFTLWFDSLSGTDDEDASSGDFGTFNTLQDTGHKFYGFMDNFLNYRTNGTAYYGLEDYALKTKFKISDVNTLKVDVHHFETQTDLTDEDSDTLRDNDGTNHNGAVTSDIGSDLGSEIDVVLIHKYDANTKMIFGYGHYWSTTAFSMLNGGGGTAGSNSNDDQDWMFVMLDTKF